MSHNDANRPWLAPVLAGGLVMGLALGARHVQGLLLLPMSLDRGWPRETIALAFAVQNLVWGLAQPITGLVADRLGSRPVVRVGTLAYAAGLLGMTLSHSAWALWLSAGLLVGLALSCTAFGVVYASLGRLVPAERRGHALGMAGAVGGLGQLALVPLTQWGIDGWGWTGAVGAMAALLALACLVAPLLSDQPTAASRQPSAPAGPALRQATREPRFWAMALGFTACGFQLALLATHLPAYLLEQGVPAQVAATGLALIALCNIPGTYACGRLGDVFKRKYLLSTLYLLRTAAIALFLLLPVSTATVLCFCAVMGTLWLGTVPLTSGLLAQMFGVRHLGAIFGLVFLGHQLGAFFGVWLGGKVHDQFGSYEPMWLAAMALGLLSAGLHWPLDDRPHRLATSGATA